MIALLFGLALGIVLGIIITLIFIITIDTKLYNKGLLHEKDKTSKPTQNR